jgi:predicted DNA-binding transcriptional regulator AlpA
MNLYEILKDNPSLNITINAGQLFEAIDYAISKTKAEFEEQVESILLKTKEVFDTKQIPEQYLTIQETAKMLGKDRSTLHRWNHKEKSLKPIRVGGTPKYKLSDINNILQKVD